MVDQEDLTALRTAASDPEAVVDLAVWSCAYGCQSRGWERRDGYDQAYCGTVAMLNEDRRLVVVASLGHFPYTVCARFDEILGVGARG